MANMGGFENFLKRRIVQTCKQFRVRPANVDLVSNPHQYTILAKVET